MKKTICCLFAMLLCLPLHAADDARKIAKVNSDELHELALLILLSKPENAARKEEFGRLRGELATTQFQMGACTDEESRKKVQQKFAEASQKEEDFRKSLESETMRVIQSAIKEVSKGRFVAVLNESANETIVFKDAELVDITYDIKERLMATPAAKPENIVIVSPDVQGR
jgi:hypothetical protein